MRRRSTVAVIIATVGLSLTAVAMSAWAETSHGAGRASLFLGIAVVLAFVVVGAVVAAARPANRVGWLMLTGGCLWAVGEAAVDLATRGIVTDVGSVPGASAFAVAGSAIRGVGWLIVVAGVPMVFPDGRLLSRRWRLLSGLLVAAGVTTVLGAITAGDANLLGLGSWANPIAWGGATGHAFSGALSLIGVTLGLAATAGAAAQLVARFRNGPAQDRQPIVMLATAVALTVVVAPVAAVTGTGWVFSLAALPLPFVIGVGVLARGLYDLKTAANRTLVWFTLSAVVAGIYALVIVGLAGLLQVDATGWLAWVAAAVVAVSFAPLRDLLQGALNRLTYGGWEEPYEVLATLGTRLQGSHDTQRLLDDVVSELTGLGLQQVSITDASGVVVAGAPQLSAAHVIPLTAYGRPCGSLHYRSPESRLRGRDQRLLSDLAGHLGAVVETRELVNQLQSSLERLVLAREEERRRLRRDIHDGLGPSLAGAVLRIDVIETKLRNRASVAADVAALRGDLRETVAEVRRVVEGLRPPALDDLGLPTAIEQFAEHLVAGTSTSVTIASDDCPRLPAAVEVAAYRIATEALTNTIRHSGSTHCQVRLTVEDGTLVVSVEDDGHGFGADPRRLHGHGLSTMRERAEELRGTLTISSTASGTFVRAELPILAHQLGLATAAAST